MSEGPWTKVRWDLKDDPSAVRMARRLKLADERYVVGILLDVWRWFAFNTEDGRAHPADSGKETRAWIDRLGGHPGLAAAMEEVGWLEVEPTGEVAIPRFERFICSVAKARRVSRETTRRARKAPRRACDTVCDSGCDTTCDTTCDTVCDTTCDSTRDRGCDYLASSSSSGVPQGEEDPDVLERLQAPLPVQDPGVSQPPAPSPRSKRSKPSRNWIQEAKDYPLPEEVETPQVRELWCTWVDARALIPAPMSPGACRIAAAKLSAWDEGMRVKVLEAAVERGWRGLFEPQEWSPNGRAQEEDFEAEVRRRRAERETERMLRRWRREEQAG